MGSSGRDVIVKISLFDSVKIYLSSLVVGAWFLLTVIIGIIWRRKNENPEHRGNPPACLTDTSLGNHSFIKIKGVKLHFVEAGSKSSPLLLLLHDFPDCWISWRYQIPELAKHYRVIALDLKGFGDSDKPVSSSVYQVHCLVEELGDLVESLTPSGQVTLVGHGLGALLGWFYLHFRPDTVSKFVSLASPHPNFYWSKLPSSSLFNSRWISLCQLPYVPIMKVMEKDLNLINLAHPHLSLSKPPHKELLDAYKYLFSRTEDWLGAINYFKIFPFLRLAKRSIDVPCLLLAGNEDSNIKLESIISSTDYLQKYSLKLVEGATHYLHQENPSEVNKILLDFLVEYVPNPLSKSGSDGLVYKVFGVVSSTVNAFQKKTGNITSKVRDMSLRQSTC